MMNHGGAILAVALNGNGAYAVSWRDRLSNHEVQYVRERRQAVRASWQDCARMVDRPVHDVRMACDPDYAKAHDAPASVPLGRPRLEEGGAHARVLLAIAGTRSSARRASDAAWPDGGRNRQDVRLHQRAGELVAGQFASRRSASIRTWR
jgi:hypothetical protein